MKLRMLTAMSGPAFTLEIGEIWDFGDQDEVGRLIEAGFAEPVEQIAATATKPTEKAVKPDPAETR